MNLIDQAILIAVEAHAGQKRKVGGAPYIVHPVAVAITVARNLPSDEAIIVALLHDVLEDTDYPAKKIREIFGEKILRYVLDLSEEDKSHPWKIRKQRYINHLSEIDEIPLAVCAADKINNMKSMLEEYSVHGKKSFENFNASFDEQLWYSAEILAVLKKKLKNPMVAEYHRILKELKSLRK